MTAAIGAGGMGEVWRATDTRLGRHVALKLLPAAFATDPDRLSRFEREAKLLASLNHSTIAHLYGFEQATLPDGSNAHLLVMELVEGEDLAERLKRGPVPVDEAVAIARQIAEALEEAHEKGIVHRDLKPANVKVTPDGRVKVLDFGLAKAWTGEGPGATSSPDLSQSPTLAQAGTAAGIILGTAAYMSPEQARGKPVDKRADIWAFGVVLFEMLAGQRLFDGETVSDVLAAVLAREIDWSRLPAGTPPPVRHVLGRCLERDPRQRLRDIADARHDLQGPGTAAASTIRAGTAATPGHGRRTALLMAATGLAAVALFAAVVSWRKAPAPRDPMVFSLPAPPGTRLNQVVIAPDGRSLVFAAESASGESHLWLRSLDSRDARRLEGTEGAREPFWSPDARFIGFFTEAQLWKLEAATGAVEALAATTDTRGGAWRPDGTIVFGGARLNRASAGGGAVSPALDVDGASGENAIRYPSFLPDWSHVLYYSRNAKDRARAGLWVHSLDSGVRKHLTAAAASSAVYVDPGYLLYRRDRYLVAHPFDARRLEFTGEPRPIAEDVWYDPGVTAQTNVSASANGIVTFRTGGVELSDLAWYDRQGRLAGTEWEAKGFASLSLSRDGRQILATFPGQGVERHVWLYDRATATARQVTSAGDTITLVFSDDARRAVLGGHRGAVSGLWLALLGSGTAPEPLATKASAAPFAMDWRGHQVIYSALAPGDGRLSRSINLLDLETGEDGPIVDTPGNELFSVISPDGRRLAYASDETGQWEVYVATFPRAGERWRVSASGGHQPRWNPDGSELFYIAPDRRMMSVRVRSGSGFEWDAPRPLFQTEIVDLGPFRGSWGYAVAPDGQRFLILTRRPQGSSPAVAIVNWKSAE
ncbi:MAG TPA: protein kinase [Vicinamibacteria bacterium]|nr:protein kinase [Vicinamibacteria bacterium]